MKQKWIVVPTTTTIITPTLEHHRPHQMTKKQENFQSTKEREGESESDRERATLQETSRHNKPSPSPSPSSS
jgi:hypothetical protein